MKHITLEQILALHVLAIEQFGGSDGLRDLGRLEAALATQHQEVFGEELYRGVFEKAAALCRGIVGDHPFADGNKRTAMLVAITFVERNGHEFVAKKGELEDFAVQVAVEHLDVPTIAAWLRAHSHRR
jgi:death-on-curing protein